MKSLFALFLLFPLKATCQIDSLLYATDSSKYYQIIADDIEASRIKRLKNHPIVAIADFYDFLRYAKLPPEEIVKRLTPPLCEEWYRDYNDKGSHYIVLVNKEDTQQRIEVDYKKNRYYITYSCFGNPSFYKSAMDYIQKWGLKKTNGDANGSIITEQYDNIELGMTDPVKFVFIKRYVFGYGKMVFYTYGIVQD